MATAPVRDARVDNMLYPNLSSTTSWASSNLLLKNIQTFCRGAFSHTKTYHTYPLHHIDTYHLHPLSLLLVKPTPQRANCHHHDPLCCCGHYLRVRIFSSRSSARAIATLRRSCRSNCLSRRCRLLMAAPACSAIEAVHMKVQKKVTCTKRSNLRTPRKRVCLNLEVVVVVVVRASCSEHVSVDMNAQRMHLIGWQNTWEQAPGVPATPSPP